MTPQDDVYICCDIEADGPIPGPYSMLSLGMSVAGRFDGRTFTRLDPAAETFYAELAPVSSQWDQESLRVSGLDRDRLVREGEQPAPAMRRAANWVEDVAGTDRPVFVSYPLGYDWMFVYWYFQRFLGAKGPFGHSVHLDIKTLFAVKAGVTVGAAVRKNLAEDLAPRRPATHHARDDAMAHADLLANLMTLR
ncbi:exonuclease [Streptomyces sp. NPDC059629]|uniref:exonuclease n=1 Tax=Streptomyces sp. NPDC059629 TaxID=3346889 RepID=UPI0036AF54C4